MGIVDLWYGMAITDIDLMEEEWAAGIGEEGSDCYMLFPSHAQRVLVES